MLYYNMKKKKHTLPPIVTILQWFVKISYTVILVFSGLCVLLFCFYSNKNIFVYCSYFINKSLCHLKNYQNLLFVTLTSDGDKMHVLWANGNCICVSYLLRLPRMRSRDQVIYIFGYFKSFATENLLAFVLRVEQDIFLATRVKGVTKDGYSRSFNRV